MNHSEIDVLLINPGHLRAVYQDLAEDFSAIEPPTNAALFASYLRHEGLSVVIVDVPALNLAPEEVAELVDSDYRPRLVVMVVYGFQPSASTQNMPSAGAICRAIKRKNPQSKIMMTGTHPAALPERTLREETVDFVCSGEGPETILQTARAIKNKAHSFRNIPSLWFWEEDKAVSTPAGSLMEDLDSSMAEPAWDLLPMSTYRCHNWHAFGHLSARQPYASLHTSLGCPFKCSFCCINAPFGRPAYRMWSPHTVVRQIDRLVTRYQVRNIKIVDEMFVLNPTHVSRICDLLIERQYDLNIWAYARVDTVKVAQLEKLKRAGFRWLALGIESGSKHVRDGVEKGRFGTEAILKIVHDIQEHGINVIGNYIFGLPDDDSMSMKETLDLAKEANCEFANFYSAMAYPGSRLYGMAIENGWALPESWIGYSQHSRETFPLRTEHLTAAEVLAFRDKAFLDYFTSDKYLSMIKRKFGQQTVDHLKVMTTFSLKRDILAQV